MNPMRNSGVQIDPLTRQPVNLEDAAEKEAQAAKERLMRLTLQNQQLRMELLQNKGEIIRVLEAEMLARAEEVTAADPQFQALQNFAGRLGAELNVLPALIRRKIKNLIGEEVYQLIEADTAAPERDTGQ